MTSTLFKLPARVRCLPIGELRRQRDDALKPLQEPPRLHRLALLEKLVTHPFHLASRVELLGQREDKLNDADRESLKPEMAFLELCRRVYDAEHAATAAHLVRATQKELL